MPLMIQSWVCRFFEIGSSFSSPVGKLGMVCVSCLLEHFWRMMFRWSSVMHGDFARLRPFIEILLLTVKTEVQELLGFFIFPEAACHSFTVVLHFLGGSASRIRPTIPPLTIWSIDNTTMSFQVSCNLASSTMVNHDSNEVTGWSRLMLEILMFVYASSRLMIPTKTHLTMSSILKCSLFSNSYFGSLKNDVIWWNRKHPFVQLLTLHFIRSQNVPTGFPSRRISVESCCQTRTTTGRICHWLRFGMCLWKKADGSNIAGERICVCRCRERALSDQEEEGHLRLKQQQQSYASSLP